MIIALFKQKTPANVAVLFIFGLLIKIPVFLHPETVQATANNTVYQYLTVFTEKSTIASAFLAFLLIYIQALILNHTVNAYRMTVRQTFLPGMSLMLITSLIPEWNYLSPQLIASVGVTWAFSTLFRLYNQETAKGIVYNIGLIIGLSSYIFFPSAVFLISICIGMAILKPFRINELLLLFIGALTPYYFCAVYLFLTDQFTLDRFLPDIHIGLPSLQVSGWLWVAAILLFVPFFAGAYSIYSHLRRMVIQVRKNWPVFIFYLLAAIAIPFMNDDNHISNWLFMAVPLAAFHTNAYLFAKKRWMAQVLFFMILAFILIQQFIQYVG